MHQYMKRLLLRLANMTLTLLFVLPKYLPRCGIVACSA